MSLLGLYVEPDNWPIGERLQESDGYSDSGFPGCQYRLPSGPDNWLLAVNVSFSGRKSHWCRISDNYRTRVKIEFVGDCEPSTFSHGWIYSEQPFFKTF